MSDKAISQMPGPWHTWGFWQEDPRLLVPCIEEAGTDCGGRGPSAAVALFPCSCGYSGKACGLSAQLESS